MENKVIYKKMKGKTVSVIVCIVSHLVDQALVIREAPVVPLLTRVSFGHGSRKLVSFYCDS